MPEGKEKAQAKVERFFRELGKSPAEVTAGAAAHYKKLISGTAWGGLMPMETYALQELADIVWRGPYQDYADLPQVQQTDFKQDGLAALKKQMAPLPPEAQRKSLIDTLAVGDSAPQQQLLLNLGCVEAAQAVVDKLKEMDGDRKKYFRTGFGNLFQVLQASGDTSHAELWTHFEADSSLGIFATNIHDGKFKKDGITHFNSGY
jgi:hypothetical protein